MVATWAAVAAVAAVAAHVAHAHAHTHAHTHAPKLDPEFARVTCGSAIKLTHVNTGFKLHSHEIPYGTGSGQQSVTGYPENDDTNSYFVVMNAFGKDCDRGTPILCGSTIRLRHMNTGKYLHSHLIPSPLSQNQEVSCYVNAAGTGDTGDNWLLTCEKDVTEWMRESSVRLKHVDTGMYLTSTSQYKFQHPIPGQQEVYGSKTASALTQWAAQEGIYVADRGFFDRTDDDDDDAM